MPIRTPRDADRPTIRGLAFAAIAAAIALADPVRAQDGAAARNPRTAQPDRPTVAYSPGIVSPGHIELETGLEFDHRADQGHNGIATLNTKVGVTRRMHVVIVASAFQFSDATGGFGDLAVGVKWRPLDAHPLLGDFAIQPLLKFPNGSRIAGTGTGTTDLSLLFISGRDLGPVHLDLNYGVTLRNGDGTAAPTFASIWTTSFSGAVRGPLGWCAEFYGYPATSGPAGSASLVGFLVGPWYEVNRSLIVDIGVLLPVRGAQPRALYMGVTWNAGRRFGR